MIMKSHASMPTNTYAWSFLRCTTKDLLNTNICPKPGNSVLQVSTLSCINQDTKTLYFCLLFLNYKSNYQIYFCYSSSVWKSIFSWLLRDQNHKVQPPWHQSNYNEKKCRPTISRPVTSRLMLVECPCHTLFILL